MSDLAAWLLERISEDEAPTWELVPYECEPGCCAPAAFVGHRCLICDTVDFGGTVEIITEISREHDERIHRRARVLAECEAKRRIVEEHRPIPREKWACRTCFRALHFAGPCPTLRLLALPYADHPDYWQEWRP